MLRELGITIRSCLIFLTILKSKLLLALYWRLQFDGFLLFAHHHLPYYYNKMTKFGAINININININEYISIIIIK